LYADGNGCSIRAIAKELRISRTTVSKYLLMNENEINEALQNSTRVKSLDPYRDYFVHQLQKYPRLSATKIKRKLNAKGLPPGHVSDRTFRRYINDLKKTVPVKQQRYYEPVIDMVPGVQCQVDLGEIRNVPIGGIPTTIYFAVFVLSYSRLMYFSVSCNPFNTNDFIMVHDEAFKFFGGVVEECVYDQTKLVSIKEEFREVWFNEEFYRYATFARFDIRVCEGFDPESKGKVEAGVKYVKNSFFYGEEFASFKELDQDRLMWLQRVANMRIHGTTHNKPIEMFQNHEAQKLKPYLSPGFILEEPVYKRTVDKTSLISYKSNKYSVPVKYQSSVVGLRQEEASLIILDMETKEVLATHSVCEGKGVIVKNTNHYRNHDKVVKDREQELPEVIGCEELSLRLCRILKTTSPKIYKDQLVGLKEVLSGYPAEKALHDALCELSKRQRLTVTFIREYLDGLYSNRQSQVESLDAVGVNGTLAAYGCLSRSTKEAHRHVEL
jgi:transposase